MVFASSAIAQAAALGVALSFWMPIIIDPVRHAAGHQAGTDVHLMSSLLFEPVLWAIARVAAGDAGLHRQPGAAAPDAREPARPGLPGQRRGRGDRRRPHHAGGARSVGDPVRQRRGGAARGSGAGVGGDGRAAGRTPAVLARADLRRLRPDRRARAGAAGAAPQRLPVPVDRNRGRAVRRARSARCRCSRSACCRRWRRWRSRRACRRSSRWRRCSARCRASPATRSRSAASCRSARPRPRSRRRSSAPRWRLWRLVLAGAIGGAPGSARAHGVPHAPRRRADTAPAPPRRRAPTTA